MNHSKMNHSGFASQAVSAFPHSCNTATENMLRQQEPILQTLNQIVCGLESLNANLGRLCGSVHNKPLPGVADSQPAPAGDIRTLVDRALMLMQIANKQCDEMHQDIGTK